ncbi:hypothetical protein Acor_82720 [Acrocarpospora corrugata]|uniref:Uncharacterized protein n=1 Tax=Acrocarpospora corrugata TaxID=35763 RepID=A0A5M3WGA9_9ACTN|nr:hypothetical protein [Acrocarpospora corrugata]GES06203.1 hypothetical protein Acor_82720 [Acrocarpospora corrugata]
MGFFSHLTAVAAVGALLIGAPATLYLFSTDSERRARALRLLRLLLRR